MYFVGAFQRGIYGGIYGKLLWRHFRQTIKWASIWQVLMMASEAGGYTDF